MISILRRDKYLLLRSAILVTVFIPLVITTYEFIVLGNDSVVFLAEYPSAIGILVIIYYSILLVAGLLWLINQLKSLISIRNENRKNELLHLQSQVNPHFFFNMLNNLYGLVDRDSDAAKKLILKLSDLMRYSIYEGEKSTVTLSEEISYLKNYIELHKMRYHKEIAIQFNTEVINDDIKIKPLLLIILLENAFKHGVENITEKAYVTVDLISNNEKLNFNIENNFDKNENSNSVGIGLKNLRRRLQLAYPDRHRFTVENTGSVYKAKLELQLR